jgi:hypothetical protein
VNRCRVLPLRACQLRTTTAALPYHAALAAACLLPCRTYTPHTARLRAAHAHTLPPCRYLRALHRRCAVPSSFCGAVCWLRWVCGCPLCTVLHATPRCLRIATACKNGGAIALPLHGAALPSLPYPSLCFAAPSFNHAPPMLLHPRRFLSSTSAARVTIYGVVLTAACRTNMADVRCAVLLAERGS